MGDDEMEEFLDAIWNAIQDAPPVSEEAPPISRMANDKVAESIHPIETPTLHQKPPKLRNNARKRKSQELEEELVAGSSKKPCAAKVEVPKAMAQLKTAPTVNKGPSTKAAASQATQPPMSARLPGLTKDPNTHLSQRQQAELNQIIEKVKARPGKLKTLYVLKREKSKKSGADDVRSGRAVVKPLAYWSAEQCVYNNSNDGAAGLELGARIPLGSIKEIARDTTKKTRGAADGDSDAEPEDATSSLNGPYEDGHEEPWEREIGVFRGQANVWSQPHQTTLEDAVEETDLAYHPSSMLTREVKGSGFKYAKLISTPFFGSGIVDLPPGTSKLPKNSRTMHMCFFVFKGRVTVRIGEGIEEGDCERFSIGKGGVFQVPRGMFSYLLSTFRLGWIAFLEIFFGCFGGRSAKFFGSELTSEHQVTSTRLRTCWRNRRGYSLVRQVRRCLVVEGWFDRLFELVFFCMYRQKFCVGVIHQFCKDRWLRKIYRFPRRM